MQEVWREIVEFPGYSVSNTGFVRNDETGWLMVRHVNQRGILNVSLVRDKIRHKRSVTVLVANAFVQTARPLTYDTPINLDGDRHNNNADNLAWRPRWYAMKYSRQFHEMGQIINRPVQELKSKEVFDSSLDAGIAYGLLNEEVVRSILDRTYAWPTYQRFQLYV